MDSTDASGTVVIKPLQGQALQVQASKEEDEEEEEEEEEGILPCPSHAWLGATRAVAEFAVSAEQLGVQMVRSYSVTVGHALACHMTNSPNCISFLCSAWCSSHLAAGKVGILYKGQTHSNAQIAPNGCKPD